MRLGARDRLVFKWNKSGVVLGSVVYSFTAWRDYRQAAGLVRACIVSGRTAGSKAFTWCCVGSAM